MERQQIRIAIKGFGRIGRAFFRICLEDLALSVVAIIDSKLTIREMAYLIKYDSIYGVLKHDVKITSSIMEIDGKQIHLFNTNSVDYFQLEKQGIDVLVDASGDKEHFEDQLLRFQAADFHTVITRYVSDDRITNFIYGFHDPGLLSKLKVLSLANCDSSATVPVLNFLAASCGIESASVVTLHPYLGSQNLLDGKTSGTDLTLGRSAINNLIPKSTSLQSMLRSFFPEQGESIIAMSFRIPTSSVANAIIHLTTKLEMHPEALRSALASWCKDYCASFGLYAYDPCTSIDYAGTPYSFIIDDSWIACTGDKVRMCIWYDNEWGYASRIRQCIEDLFFQGK